MHALAFRGLLAAAVMVMAGCPSEAPLTELIIVVDSDLAVPMQMDVVRVVVDTPGGQHHDAQAMLTPGSLPVTMGLQHLSGPTSTVAIEVTGLLGAATVVTARVSTEFMLGQSRVVLIVLRRTCLRVSCAADMTCGPAGTCESATVLPETLPLFDGTVPRADAGVGGDSSVSCACRVPTDICRGGVCVSPGAVCSGGCPTNYACAGTECTCAQPDVCGAICATDSQCLPTQQCDLLNEVCRQRLACSGSWMCPGERCLQEPRSVVYSCRPLAPGGLPLESACTFSSDCQSTLCIAGACARPCRSSLDCTGAVDTQCAQQDSADLGAPIPASALACDIDLCTCPTASDICLVDLSCLAGPACERNSECPPAAECSFNPLAPFPTCLATSVRRCAPDELLLGGAACSNGQGCWPDAAVPTCLAPRTFVPVAVGQGLCGTVAP